MSDVYKMLKKTFTVGVVATTILWSVGASVLVTGVATAATCPTMKTGDIYKSVLDSAVYVYNSDGQGVYWDEGWQGKTWYSASTAAVGKYVEPAYPTVLSLSSDCFKVITQRNTSPYAVSVRPGSHPFYRPGTTDLYYVTDNYKVTKIDADAAEMFFGKQAWRTATVKYWPFFTVETGTITKTSLPPMGMLVNDGTKSYLVTDNKGAMQEVTAAGLTANNFNLGYAYKMDSTTKAKMTVATTTVTAQVSTLTNLTKGAEGATTTTTTTSGTATVSLSSNTPAAKTIADGTAYNTMLVLNVKAGTDKDVKLEGLTVTRTGLISNTNVTGVSVWDSKGVRYGEVMTSFNTSDQATIGFASNPLLVAKGTTEEVYVKFNLGTSASGGTVGAKVALATDVDTDGTVSGSFPFAGAEFSVVDGAASLSAVTVDAQDMSGTATGGTANFEIDETKEIAKIKFTETSGYNDVQVESINFYMNGTVDDNDLKDFTVYDPSNNKLGSATYAKDSYVTVKFDTPYTVEKSKNRTLTLKATAVDGSGHEVYVQVQNEYDVIVKDKALGYYLVSSDSGGGTWTAEASAAATGYYIIKSGAVTLSKASDSASGQVSAGADDFVLAKFNVKAVGEDMEIRKIGIAITTPSGSSYVLSGNVQLRVGNTVLLSFSGAYSTALYSTGSQRTLSQYLTIKSGQTAVLEVVGNINDSATSADSYLVGIGNFYAKRLSTKDFVDNQPSSAYSTQGNTVTVNSTSVTLVKDTSYGNTTVAMGGTQKLGQFVLQAGSSEGVCLTNMAVTLNGNGVTGGTSAPDDLQNLELWVGSTQIGSTVSTVATSSNSFSMNYCLEANASVKLEVHGYVLSSATAGTATTSLTSFSYVGKTTGNSTTDTTTLPVGQAITYGSANALLTAVNDSTTISSVLNPSTTAVQLGKWKLDAQNDALTLSKITFQVRSNTGADDITAGNFGTLYLYDSSNMTTALASATYVGGTSNGYVRFQGFSLVVPNNGSKTLVLKGTINGGSTMDAASGNVFVVRSDGTTDMTITASAGGTLSTSQIDAVAGDNVANSRFATSTNYLFHNASPVIANYSLGSTLTLSSAAPLFRFTVTNNGDREMKLSSMTINVSASGLTAASASTGTIGTWALYEANSFGQPGVLLQSTSTCELQGGADQTGCYSNSATGSTLNVSFGPGIASDNWTDDYILVAAGGSRTFVMTADTTGIFNGKTTGSVSISCKMDGATGYDASTDTYETDWAAGVLLYYYKQSVGGSYNSTAYAASDSYDVTGDTLTRSL
ncbi:MAG: hypothetical protein COU31_04575 [Candidatus Magasanikbacteria bacterium CG10_big_fil_rev_8_21_14_0_10_40_10]|uniref:LTD domain-containing protein n=1 Tax=Candidatus Magasanikbacteria bacterium CG10_big_fil_rev_8_21_14_0_10_40_10 TaxID=1974648 RepID=A0A2M6W2T8_9BACT|nr:MAG: hypothetical protein COU31_04575 [Candidatus Magasanikbacteria bacterium CG10_big_fil_rev_8_21_14_0_10_40_10]